MFRSQDALGDSSYRRSASITLPWSGAWKLPIFMINRKAESSWITLPLSMKPWGMYIIPSTFLALAVAHPAIYPLLNSAYKFIAVIIFVTPPIRFFLVAIPLVTVILALDYLALTDTNFTGSFCSWNWYRSRKGNPTQEWPWQVESL